MPEQNRRVEIFQLANTNTNTNTNTNANTNTNTYPPKQSRIGNGGDIPPGKCSNSTKVFYSWILYETITC